MKYLTPKPFWTSAGGVLHGCTVDLLICSRDSSVFMALLQESHQGLVVTRSSCLCASSSLSDNRYAAQFLLLNIGATARINAVFGFAAQQGDFVQVWPTLDRRGFLVLFTKGSSKDRTVERTISREKTKFSITYSVYFSARCLSHPMIRKHHEAILLIEISSTTINTPFPMRQ